ncbi:MAG: DUF5698 domain-containing protein [Planctomycetota bacterium]
MSTIDALFAGRFGPLVIFLLRIVDVSLSTTRVLLLMRGAKRIVPCIAFFETLIWIFGVGNAMKHMGSTWHLLGYACGFAAGNVVGMWLEERVAFGFATVRVISRNPSVSVGAALRAHGFGVTEFRGQGREGDVDLVLTVVRRRDVERVQREVERVDPTAFVTVEEPKAIQRGWLRRSPGSAD